MMSYKDSCDGCPRRPIWMKTIILATLLAFSAVATGTAPAFADGSLSVHGTFGGNTYGR